MESIQCTKRVELPIAKRIVFLGDSITENGTYIQMIDAYFQKHMPARNFEFINLGVSSETLSGEDESDHPFPRPCVHERLDRALAETRPDWVVLCYGMNDGIYHPFSEERFLRYQSGYIRAVEQIQAAGALPLLMTPPPFDAATFEGELQPAGRESYGFQRPYAGYDREVLGRYTDWVLDYGRREKLAVVDIRGPLLQWIQVCREQNSAYRYGDGIHPEADGHWVMARTILARVFHIELERIPAWIEHPESSEYYRLIGERRQWLDAAWREHVGHTNPNKAKTPGLVAAREQAQRLMVSIREAADREGGETSLAVSAWSGAKRMDFYLDGRECILVAPHEPAKEKPWVWRTEFFDAFAEADRALLHQGWHIAYIRLSNLYGHPDAAAMMRSFQDELAATNGLSERPALFGFSRGGLYALRYAGLYPAKVSSVYLDAPVVDIRSWPGGSGNGHGSPEEWSDCLGLYGITAEEAGAVTDELLNGMTRAAESGIPILLISGDSDEAVPLEENGALLVASYREQGGRIEQIVKPGGRHHPHGLPDVAPIVSFVTEAFASYHPERVIKPTTNCSV
ncbi:SGNH/GDSL hydrolase family protein [Paenibacillus sacheonensis]|uniref:SGNH hydrolase-type esterase domain-containing protein n=1 Tax=Paenibacillus sacheonensis TaxID=742054 RepID=A0A7X5C015_9BACL|nr:GDSL-type esterase/lipase family protein [Paenibacillus sacheonensis]MBM7565895.1 lysophospholipase L1-like esterase/pimeloyl-ACP methyl ester carboxylesterase [Paenibacillus sacheonensis]NBC68790.1 hypothetical protein [Paenibacillus sacheonensis]